MGWHRMKLRIFDTQHDAGLYAASQVEQTVLENKYPVLGLATGSTPIPLYEALVHLHRNGLDLSTVTTINLDEYIGIPPTHPQSFRYFMQKNLFDHVNILSKNIYIPGGMSDDLDGECKRYDEVIRKNPIYLQILGIGINGHIGFNEPDDLLLSNTHVVQLRQETIRSNARFFQSIDEVPKKAITMGVQAILQSRKIILMAFGDEKSEIVYKMLGGEVRTDVPASILQLHREITIILDEESASKLSGDYISQFIYD